MCTLLPLIVNINSICVLYCVQVAVSNGRGSTLGNSATATTEEGSELHNAALPLSFSSFLPPFLPLSLLPTFSQFFLLPSTLIHHHVLPVQFPPT